MKVVHTALYLLIFLTVPKLVFFLFHQDYPYFALATDGALLCGLVASVYHAALIKPGMVFSSIPSSLEQWVYFRTIGKPGGDRSDPKRLASYHRQLWWLKPYRECPECLAGQLGVVGFVVLLPVGWPFSWQDVFVSLILMPCVSIMSVRVLIRIWNSSPETLNP